MAAPRLPASSTDRGARSPRRLPRLGMPRGGERRQVGVVASLLFHGLMALLVITPLVTGRTVLDRIDQGAGGEGPAGGGGGGTRGTGGSPAAEQVSFARVQPPPPPQVSTEVVQTPPVVVPPPKPEPSVVLPPRPAPVVTLSVPDKAATGTNVSVVPGVGGGSGSDGTAGSGPGSGGGVGSGVGTGTGSGVGPGTGGGSGENYPPQPLELYLPPEPRPSRVKGTQVIAEFDVDETGKVRSMRFTETPDGGYNRKLRDMLRSITRFRPGTRPDGTPVRMTAQITFDL